MESFHMVVFTLLAPDSRCILFLFVTLSVPLYVFCLHPLLSCYFCPDQVLCPWVPRDGVSGPSVEGSSPGL